LSRIGFPISTRQLLRQDRGHRRSSGEQVKLPTYLKGMASSLSSIRRVFCASR
jgi:hypothetical protein